MWELARQTFSPSGPGGVLVQLMLIGIGTYVLGALTTAAGKGQYTKYIQIAGTFSAIATVINTIWQALNAVARVIGY